MRKVLTFDDVALVPMFNNIESRTQPNLSTRLTKNVKMKIPILAANMDSVIGKDLAKVLKRRGSVPILHRFYDKWDDVNDLVTSLRGKCFVSIGVNDSLFDLTDFDTPPLGFVLDIAHGHSKAAMEVIQTLKRDSPLSEQFRDGEMSIIAGNVCTQRAYVDLVAAGADAVKVGVGPGAACTTRQVTGFGVSQFSAIQDCAEAVMPYKIPIIADGGIRTSGDIVKALAAGADYILIVTGKLQTLLLAV